MKRYLALGLAAVLAACTSVTDGKRKADPAAAARDRVAIAADHLRKGQNEQAMDYLRQALKSDPDSAEAHNMMGVLMERDGNIRQADKEYSKATRLRDGYSQAHHNYGSFLYRQQRYKDAIKQFDLATQDVSYVNRANSFEGMGRSAWQLGRKDEAVQAFSRALKLEPGLPLSTLMLAEYQFEKKNYDASHALYKKYLQLTEGSPQTAQSLWLGIRLERRFGGKDALASYELALKRLYPASSEYKQYQQSLTAEK